MKIEMQYAAMPSDLHHGRWDCAFVGIPIDDRGAKSQEYILAQSNSHVQFSYIPSEFKIRINDQSFDKDDIVEHLRQYIGNAIVIDSTTLNFAELLILCQTFKDLGIAKVSILYVEPSDYKRKHTERSILNKRDFELSEEVTGYEAIPGHALALSDDMSQKVVFICGFESERIDRLMEDSQINSKNCICIFGVPAFSSGWEMDSFDNNISVIKERRLSGGVYFSGATNPLSVLQQLQEVYLGLDDEQQMFVVPLATKPMNIGACLFLISNPKHKVAVLYDHPTEMKGRALKIANWHLFNVTF